MEKALEVSQAIMDSICEMVQIKAFCKWSASRDALSLVDHSIAKICQTLYIWKGPGNICLEKSFPVVWRHASITNFKIVEYMCSTTKSSCNELVWRTFTWPQYGAGCILLDSRILPPRSATVLMDMRKKITWYIGTSLSNNILGSSSVPIPGPHFWEGII